MLIDLITGNAMTKAFNGITFTWKLCLSLLFFLLCSTRHSDDLLYHINLVELLSVCTEGRNVTTEIKCHSLLPLDEVVRVLVHNDTLPQVRVQNIDMYIIC